MKEFDDSDALKYIRTQVVECGNIEDDDLLLVIDTMFEYDETLSEDAPDEAFEVESIVAYVKKQLKKDSDNKVPLDLVEKIVVAELDYEDTLDEL